MRTGRLLVAVALLASVAAAGAGVISEDVTYWLDDGTSVWDPPGSALEQLAGRLVLKVQQTVYDNTWTRQITGIETDGFLYSYSVTNLAYVPSELHGLNMFEVAWPSKPLYVAISPQNHAALRDPNSGLWIKTGWVPSISGTSPRYHWQQADTGGPAVIPGLLPGSTATFWAVSAISADTHVIASASGVPDPPQGYPFLTGETSGPMIPEPTPALALASCMALALAWCRTNRRPR
jgi:hypothetical protein